MLLVETRLNLTLFLVSFHPIPWKWWRERLLSTIRQGLNHCLDQSSGILWRGRAGSSAVGGASGQLTWKASVYLISQHRIGRPLAIYKTNASVNWYEIHRTRWTRMVHVHTGWQQCDFKHGYLQFIIVICDSAEREIVVSNQDIALGIKRMFRW